MVGASVGAGEGALVGEVVGTGVGAWVNTWSSSNRSLFSMAARLAKDAFSVRISWYKLGACIGLSNTNSLTGVST